jgi:hypothetical protein
MSDSIEVVLDDRTYEVPKKWVRKLLAHQVDGYKLTQYDVKSRVPPELFEEFLGWLAIETTPEVTKGNARAMRSLALDFRLPDLEERCKTVSEADLGPLRPVVLGIAAQLLDPEVESRALRSERSRRLAMAKMRALGKEMDRACGVIRPPRRDGPVAKIECLRHPKQYPNGFIAYLAITNSVDLHRMAIVTVRSSSVCEDNPKWAPQNTLEFNGFRSFRSCDWPWQWICWTFHFRLVIVTEYTIISNGLRSWSLEGSGDARYWTVIDRRTNTDEFKGSTLRTATFGVAAEVTCRYVRLIQTGPTHRARARNRLSLTAVEFFGTLLEPHYL